MDFSVKYFNLAHTWKGKEGKGREGKERGGKGREGKGREGKGREGMFRWNAVIKSDVERHP